MAITKTVAQKQRECKMQGKVYDSKTKRCRQSRREADGPTLAEKKARCEAMGKFWNPTTKRCNATASRRSVFHGKGLKTSGGLTSRDLFQDKYGRIRSRAASRAAKTRWASMDPSTRAIFAAQQYR